MRHPHPTGDKAELIRRCNEWIVAHRHRLLGCALKHADDRTDVALLLTDTLKRVVRVFCKRSMGEELMIRYTMRSIRNAARELHRKNLLRYKAEKHYGREELEQRQQYQDPIELEERHMALQRAMQKLPEYYSNLLKMRLWDEMTFADIATQNGVSESTVRRHYETAIEQVRKLMGTL